MKDHINLDDPEAVKQYVKKLTVLDTTKRHYIIAYNHYTQYYNIAWKRPRYSGKAKIIKVPSTHHIDALISNAKQPLSMKLDISKQTGMRQCEIYALHPQDIDLEKGLIYPATAKHGNPRILQIKPVLKELIAKYISEHNIAQDELLFKEDVSEYEISYQRSRNRLANKLNDPTLKTVRLYDFRHYYASMLYHDIRGIVIVAQHLGHTNLGQAYKTYIHLLTNEDSEWICKIAQNDDEEAKLMEANYQYTIRRKIDLSKTQITNNLLFSYNPRKNTKIQMTLSCPSQVNPVSRARIRSHSKTQN